MSMNYYQPPPPQTTSSLKIGVILLAIFVGVPLVLGVVGGVAIWGLAGFPGVASKEYTARAAWRRVITKKRSVDRQYAQELKDFRSKYPGGREPGLEGLQVLSKWLGAYQEIKNLVDQTERIHGPMPADLLAELRSTVELERILGPRPSSPFGAPSPSGPFSESTNKAFADMQAERERRTAQERVEYEQRMARIQADQQAREQERVQRNQQLEAQRLADQQAREQREREQRERDEQLRQQLAANRPVFNVAPPPPVNPPPVFNQPVNPQPAPINAGVVDGQGQNQAPPGFPATDLAQVKPRDIVFVQAGGQWVEALVQAKRGKLVQVRAGNGDIATVTLERIRLQSEPVAKAESNLPSALRAAEAPKALGKKEEEQDDALFVAKPPGDQTASKPEPPAAAPLQSAATPSKPAAPAAEYRLWTSDTGSKIEAELVSFEFDLVQLRRRDGKVHSLRIERLSAEDQKIVREKFP